MSSFESNKWYDKPDDSQIVIKEEFDTSEEYLEHYEDQKLTNDDHLLIEKYVKMEESYQDDEIDIKEMHSEVFVITTVNDSAQEDGEDKYHPPEQVKSSTNAEEFLYTQELLDSNKNNKKLHGKNKRKENSRSRRNKIRKIKQIRGEEYIGSRGKFHNSRPLLPAPCKQKRNHICCALVSEEDRKLIYKTFREMDSYEHQKQYIVNHIEKNNKKRTSRNLDNSRRNFTYHYSLTVSRHNDANDTLTMQVSVCREFFLATLNVSDAMVRNSVTKSQLGVAQPDSSSDCHTPNNKKCDKPPEVVHKHSITRDLEYYEDQILTNDGSLTGKGIKIEENHQNDVKKMHSEVFVITTLNDSVQDDAGGYSGSSFNDIKTPPDKYHPSEQVESSTNAKEFPSTKQLLDSKNKKNNELKGKTKRKGDPSLWKKNIRKTKKIRGQEYVASDGKLRDSRPLLPAPCKGKSKHNNCAAIKEEERELIYKTFRGMKSYEEQKQYIVNHIEKTYKSRTTRNLKNSRRSFTYHYYLPVAKDKVVVCREFFQATLNVSDTMVRNCVTKAQLGVAELDNRGRHTPHNKTSDKAAGSIFEHIANYPAHYCHGTISERKCRDGQMNITCMYREYKLKCEKEGFDPVSLSKYRNVFNEFNISCSKV